MSTVPFDHLRVLYRTLLVFATVGTVILSVGLVQFVYFERPGEGSGIHARIVGVYIYDPSTRQTTGPDRREFARSDQFAAVVDWTSIPGNVIVDARWFDTFGVIEGDAGPAPAADLAGSRIVPVKVPQGYHFVLPGRYQFVVERVQDGVPVEVLARRFEVVDRT
ncbi:MAG TPA: hypothetical protein VKE27_04150 [Candidatus Dormibacteraeota bacterium]|nr:hypothetical protein [Candidatus Dormibacteraeota bacterium]